MMQTVRTSYAFHYLIAVIGILGGVILVGLYVADFGLDYQTIIIIITLAVGLVALVLGERGIRFAFLAWIFLFILGYRAMVVAYTTIHPLTVVMWSILVLVILQAGIQKRQIVRFNIPALGWVFAIFWVWGLLVGIASGFVIGSMMTQFLNLSIMVPIFIVTSYVLQKKEYWKLSIAMAVMAATLIGFLGIIEWHFPTLAARIPGFSAGVDEAVADVTGFIRAPFAFWGHPSATFICTMMLPLTVSLFVWYKNPLIRLAVVFAIVINLYAVYLTGWRSMWATMMLTFAVMTLLARNWQAFFLAIIASLIIFNFAPPEAKERFATFVDALQGNVSAQDSSSQNRLRRIERAQQMTYDNPWGSGLTASGWVHNDPVQLAADAGALSVMVFGLWYVVTLVAILRQYLRAPDSLTLGLIGSFLVIAALFVSQPTYQHNQLMAPFWTIWAFVNVKLRQPTIEEEQTDGTGEIDRPRPYLQLRSAPAGVSGFRQVGGRTVYR